jgi:hypothetical protein
MICFLEYLGYLGLEVVYPLLYMGVIFCHLYHVIINNVQALIISLLLLSKTRNFNTILPFYT